MPNCRKSAPVVFALLVRMVPVPVSFCSHMYVSVWPESGSVAEPVRANGVRYGIVHAGAVVTVGGVLPVACGVPWLVARPPLVDTPKYPVAVPVRLVKLSRPTLDPAGCAPASA